MKSVKSSKTVEHFCEFSEGGDLCITPTKTKDTKDTSVAMVVVVPTDSPYENPSTDEEDPQPPKSANLSPLVSGGVKLSMVIEGKKDNFNLTKHKHQLWANMVVVVITEFTKTVKSFNKKVLLDLTVLTVYGMACGGDGTVGAYKLEIDLIKSQMRFITKLGIGCHEKYRPQV